MGVVLVVAGGVFRSLLPTPLRIPVVHHLPRCVSVGLTSPSPSYAQLPNHGGALR